MPDLLIRDTDRDELTDAIAAAVLDRLTPLIAQSANPILVDGDEMARLAGVSRATLDRLRAAEAIPSVLIGSRRLYRAARVIAALESGPASESDPAHERAAPHE
ncbi:helix-turn-helix transcriptional regulator [Rhodopirellula europaea]|uniref:helix-turn-helix transcriptional regulator n=1 Tax=Rhodopirellula europaea TaxID=1263866 RepID=UPI003D2E9776|tara:strand:- start:3796 stop:4107 length:312 start_codon:yes stop_codon:yes gene_type:complete